jgi:hypothetical protein
MSLTPKAKLQQSPKAKEIAALLASENFASASDVAMLTFIANLPDAPDAQSSMMYHQQLVGAKRFLSTLTNVMKPAPEPQPSNFGVLKAVP